MFPPFTHLGGNMAEIFKPLGVLGGKSLFKVVTLFLTPPFRKNTNEAKGGRPYKLLRLVTLMMMVLNE